MHTALFFLTLSAVSPILAVPVAEYVPPEKQVKVILENPTSGKSSGAYLDAIKYQEPASFINQGPFTTIEVLPGRDVSGSYSACEVLDPAGNPVVGKHNGEAHTALMAGKKWSFERPTQVATVSCRFGLAHTSGEYERRDVTEDLPTVKVNLTSKITKAASVYQGSGESLSFYISQEEFTNLDVIITGDTDCRALNEKGSILGTFRGRRNISEGSDTHEYHSEIPDGIKISQITCAPDSA